MQLELKHYLNLASLTLPGLLFIFQHMQVCEEKNGLRSRGHGYGCGNILTDTRLVCLHQPYVVSQQSEQQYRGCVAMETENTSKEHEG